MCWAGRRCGFALPGLHGSHPEVGCGGCAGRVGRAVGSSRVVGLVCWWSVRIVVYAFSWLVAGGGLGAGSDWLGCSVPALCLMCTSWTRVLGTGEISLRLLRV